MTQRLSTEQRIRSLVEAFVAELTDLIRLAAIEALQNSFSGGAGAEPLRAALNAISTTVEPAPGVARKRGRPRKIRPAADTAAIVALVRNSADGVRAEEMARALAVPPAVIKPAVATLLAENILRRTGMARGTRYYLAGAKGATPAGTRTDSNAKRARPAGTKKRRNTAAGKGTAREEAGRSSAPRKGSGRAGAGRKAVARKGAGRKKAARKGAGRSRHA